MMDHQGLDHIAIAVKDTDVALETWRDQLGFPVLFSEIVNDGAVKLTHLDMGNCHLQLVEPMIDGHPLHDWLDANGNGLHHLCLKVDNVAQAMAASPVPTAPAMHEGTRGQRALFLDSKATDGVQVEFTGA